jgi:hypothetical protein
MAQNSADFFPTLGSVNFPTGAKALKMKENKTSVVGPGEVPYKSRIGT